MRVPLQEGAPELNSVHRAEVASIKPFGVFVRMQGYRTNGLVHVSQVAPSRRKCQQAHQEQQICLYMTCLWKAGKNETILPYKSSRTFSNLTHCCFCIREVKCARNVKEERSVNLSPSLLAGLRSHGH